MSIYLVTTPEYECGVEVGQRGIIKDTGPALKEWVGQSIISLKKWIIRRCNGTVEKIANQK